ncbi:hypothetical protein BDL97_06G100500 [Sphagnum fallax]|nr:hypothetical protein BDL97_06G100500 [Sphagnum fallax]KAH8959895.1 hypothetical protein BDL97_06G100500 [Sphagnum fallax]KAH8959896.1 hypothetical protein BDL97_06G100500 [Sphagnum fallax]
MHQWWLGACSSQIDFIVMDPEAFVAHLPLCRVLPKLELHAHLNGSIRSSTLLELAAEHSQNGAVSYPELVSIIEKEKRSLPETFKLFGLIRLVTTNHQVVTRITREVIEDFAAENIIYVELRTTPKNNPAVGMTKRSYMEAVMAGFNTDSIAFNRIYVRLILSIDRRETTEAAIETENFSTCSDFGSRDGTSTGSTLWRSAQSRRG